MTQYFDSPTGIFGQNEQLNQPMQEHNPSG